MESKIICGDVLEVLKTLHTESVDCVITSPPYWGLRDYGTAKWEGGDSNCEHTGVARRCDNQDNVKSSTNRGSSSDPVSRNCIRCGAIRIDAQIGLESSPEEYVNKMVDVFREVRRVLKKEGTLWLNIGDSYSGSCGNTNDVAETLRGKELTDNIRPSGRPVTAKIIGLKPKDIVGIPWRVAFALQADGWYLRQDIIWAKPNPMPESVTDRCTKSHEYVFLLTKSPKYYYDAEAIKEPHADTPYTRERYRYNPSKGNYAIKTNPDTNWKGGELSKEFPATRNRRSVWTITTKPFSDAHFATFPEDLVEPMIKAGTSEKGVCPECGKPWVRIINSTGNVLMEHGSMKMDIAVDRHEKRDSLKVMEKKTLGWNPSCSCGKEPIPAIVMDCFAGSGTALVVAKRLGRSYLGIELNPEYVKMAERSLISMRDADDMKTLKDIQEGKQKTLFSISEVKKNEQENGDNGGNIGSSSGNNIVRADLDGRKLLPDFQG